MTVVRKRRPADTPRLDAAAWTETALEFLATGGIDGVRIELLAKRLEVTKGSFYWHFKDRDALHDSMLSLWRRRATLSLIERLDKGEQSPEARFRRLLRLPIVGTRSAMAADVELAIRLWGRRDPRAQAVLEEVDNLRLHYIGGLLRECGIIEAEARPRAILAYSYMRVAATLIPGDGQHLMEQCEDIMLGISRTPEDGSPRKGRGGSRNPIKGVISS
ncbi:TetR/AcrR family transcriptional regulator [Novosphingobium sp.]|uniref:TetR/AcrR family transcriptional regulator n=1 Tax=Novosphingobium sp. TaxID=1874826 RepID=UPI002B486B14|nr:TetR/AcrR family transcriptional regulator [Novosphingobium sp.]HKR92159.1 TetR/AcrR family transcriptional regulator [Novosphingobium sp.]